MQTANQATNAVAAINLKSLSESLKKAVTSQTQETKVDSNKIAETVKTNSFNRTLEAYSDCV